MTSQPSPATAFAGVAEDDQLYSSSLQLREALGERAGDFERDLRERLMRGAPNDRFVEDIEFTIISARKNAVGVEDR